MSPTTVVHGELADPREETWEERPMDSLGGTYGGLVGKTKGDFGVGEARYVPFTAVITGVQVTRQSLLRVRVAERERQNAVKDDDLLFNTSSETPDELAMCAVARDLPPNTYLNSFCFGFRLSGDCVDPLFLAYLFRSDLGRRLMASLAQGAIRYNLSRSQFRNLVVTLPPVEEQRAIAGALQDADRLIEILVRLIAKQEAIREGIMQQLLTAKLRLSGHTEPWRRRKLDELLIPRSERNTDGAQLDVLSCTKHQGFVKSLDYFRNQVFSRDLSTYLVIYYGDIGYPANHVEEGSIGLQDLMEKGLVSPIYVVMQPRKGVNSYFLQRLLKLDSLRQEFARATNASVNRRGSLRWSEFSKIHVSTPEQDEQHAIARVLRDMDETIDELRRRLAKAKAIERGMMQELVTGRTRLPTAEEVAA